MRLLERHVAVFLGIHAIVDAIVGIVALAIAAFLPAIVAADALVFLPHARIGDHAEIVIRVLEVGFLRHAIAIEVRVMGQLAILLQQLRSIAPRPAVDAIELLATAAALLAIVVPPAAPAVVTTNVIQG